MQPIESGVPLALKEKRRAEIMAEPVSEVFAAKESGIGEIVESIDRLVRGWRQTEMSGEASCIPLRPIEEGGRRRCGCCAWRRDGMAADDDVISPRERPELRRRQLTVGILWIVEVMHRGRSTGDFAAKCAREPNQITTSIAREGPCERARDKDARRAEPASIHGRDPLSISREPAGIENQSPSMPTWIGPENFCLASPRNCESSVREGSGGTM